MNPQLKQVGLSFQLSSPPKRDGLLVKRQQSDDRLHDGSPIAVCTEVRPYSGSECFTTELTTPANLANIRLSKTIAVYSERVQSVLSALIIPDQRKDFDGESLHAPIPPAAETSGLPRRPRPRCGRRTICGLYRRSCGAASSG